MSEELLKLDQMAAFMHQGELRITAGCRRGLTVEQARAHWSPDNETECSEKTPEYGQRQLRMLEFLIAEAKSLGWIDIPQREQRTETLEDD